MPARAGTVLGPRHARGACRAAVVGWGRWGTRRRARAEAEASRSRPCSREPGPSPLHFHSVEPLGLAWSMVHLSSPMLAQTLRHPAWAVEVDGAAPGFVPAWCRFSLQEPSRSAHRKPAWRTARCLNLPTPLEVRIRAGGTPFHSSCHGRAEGRRARYRVRERRGRKGGLQIQGNE